MKAKTGGLTKINIKLSTGNDRIRLFPISDIHIGAPEGQCEWSKIKQNVNYINTHEDHYILVLGDCLDWAPKMAKLLWRGGPNIYLQSLPPMKQIEKFKQLFAESIKKEKVLAVSSGNHENWVMDVMGADVMQLICENINVPYINMGGCEMNIDLDKTRSYRLYVAHGPGGNPRTPSSALTALFNFAENVYADVYICGHTHQIGSWKFGRMFNNRKFKSYLVYSGHYLDWLGSYAQLFAKRPVPSGTPKITLFTDRHDIHVEV
ncbi:MAG: metallophosphoesterase [Candidatus Bathyarchaeia archaeon]